MTTIDAAEPLAVLIYPDRTEVVWNDQNTVVTQGIRTFAGKLSRAKKAADVLRGQGYRITVFQTGQGDTKRIQVELRAPAEGGGYGTKRTKIFRAEDEAVEFLTAEKTLNETETFNSGHSAGAGTGGGI